MGSSDTAWEDFVQGNYIDMPYTPTIHCDAMAACRLVGCDILFAFYVNQIDPNSGEIERAVNLKLKMPVKGVVAGLPYVMRLLPQGSAEEVAMRMRMFLS